MRFAYASNGAQCDQNGVRGRYMSDVRTYLVEVTKTEAKLVSQDPSDAIEAIGCIRLAHQFRTSSVCVKQVCHLLFRDGKLIGV